MNAYEFFTDQLFAKAGAMGIPLSGTFELTSRCNLDCKMCYIHKRANDKAVINKEMSAEKWLVIAKEAQQAGMLHLLLTGGEPFIRPDFKEIYAGCRKLGLLVSINSNATLIDQDMLEFLISMPPARINITLYGASAETYGTLCGDPTAYQRVVDTILALKKAGILVKLNFSTTQYNKHDLNVVHDFAQEHNIPLQAVTYMYPPVRACENGCFAADRMTAVEAANAQFDYDQHRFTKEIFRGRLENLIAGIRVKDPDNDCQELPTERLSCRAGSSEPRIRQRRRWNRRSRLRRSPCRKADRGIPSPASGNGYRF
ncbi:MAG: radical SAM protein, partial [Firmicutes bacterium]|nr:radical SAM protein [Bacillota bacterium]